MRRASILLFFFLAAFSQVVFADASSSTNIGINIVIKESTKCDFHIASMQQTEVFTKTSSNCLTKTESIQKHLTSISYQQQVESTNNEFARVVMIVQ